MLYHENLQLYLRLELKIKKINGVLAFNQPHWLKPYVELNTQKIMEPEKYVDKGGKALYTLMNSAVYGKAMENLRKRIDVKLVSNKKDYLK